MRWNDDDDRIRNDVLCCMYPIEMFSKTTNAGNRNVWLQNFVDSVDDFAIILLFLGGGGGNGVYFGR